MSLLNRVAFGAATSGLGVVLSGCSLLSVFAPDVVATYDINGDTNVSLGEIVLTEYPVTEKTATNTLATEQDDGLEGFGAGQGPGIPVSSIDLVVATANGDFGFGGVEVNPGNAGAGITITGITGGTDGITETSVTYQFPVVGTSTGGTINGQVVTETVYLSDPHVLSVTNQNYSSLALLGLEVESDESNDARFALINGLRTPESSLPTSTVNYGGIYGIATSSSLTETTGTFDATADFNSGSISGTMTETGDTVSNGSFSGSIRGAQFDASMISSTDDYRIGSSEMIGEFFGPAAEEIGAVSSGSMIRTGGTTTDFTAYFLGNSN